jgi:GH35 family endo-1,4-beta-xylanase
MQSMKQAFDGVFNYATMPFYLADLEPQYGKPNFSYLDHLLDELEKSKITPKGHPLWWAHTAGMPAWTKDLKWDDGSVQKEIQRTITRSVKRYKGRINYYDAINENHDWCNAYNLTQEQAPLMTKLCCDTMHEADPDVHAIVNTCFMFGENAADGRTQWGPSWERNLVPYTAIEQLEELGVQYEAIGMQLYNPARDMLAIDKMYDRFKKFGKRVHLTELGVPSFEKAVSENAGEGDKYCLSYMYYGLWHEMGWNERLQADWVEQFYTITYSHPEVEAITMWNLNDPGYVPASGLYTQEFEPKESWYRLKELEKSWGKDFAKQNQ